MGKNTEGNVKLDLYEWNPSLLPGEVFSQDILTSVQFMILTIFDSLNIIFHEYHILLQESTQLKDILHFSFHSINKWRTPPTSTWSSWSICCCYVDVVVLLPGSTRFILQLRHLHSNDCIYWSRFNAAALREFNFKHSSTLEFFARWKTIS